MKNHALSWQSLRDKERIALWKETIFNYGIILGLILWVGLGR